MRDVKLMLMGLLGVVLPAIGTADNREEESLDGGSPKANVLFIAVDDLEPMLNCYGYNIAKTPKLDKLADYGSLFLNAYCQQALCGPSRVSVITGRYPDVLGIYGMGGPDTKLRKRFPDIVTLPQYFIRNCYRVATRGKIYDFRNFDGSRTDLKSWNETELGMKLSFLILSSRFV